MKITYSHHSDPWQMHEDNVTVIKTNANEYKIVWCMYIIMACVTSWDWKFGQISCESDYC